MIGGLARKIFGTTNERVVRAYRSQIEAVNGFEPAMQALSDEQLRASTDEFRTKLKNGVALNKLLPEAFAVVREASVRTLGMWRDHDMDFEEIRRSANREFD